MILKLTQLDAAENLQSGQTLLVNLDDISTIHASKISRKGAAIIGETNEVDGSIVSTKSGRQFPVKEKADDIYAKLPWPLTRDTSKLQLQQGSDPAEGFPSTHS